RRRARPQSPTAVAPAQHLSLAGQNGEPRRRCSPSAPQWPGPWQTPQFAILNHAAIDSGIPRESATQRLGISRKPGFDYMGAAYAGITSLIGEADRGPAQFATAIGDHATGVTAAMSIGFALLHRERTGEGQYIECALIDTYFNMHEVNVPKLSLRGSSFAPKRAGSLHPDGGPTGVFRYRGEEFIAIMVMPYQWNQMIKAMNMPELADDPRFNTPRGRRDNKAALQPNIGGGLAGFPSRDAAIAALEAERVPCAPVLTLHEAVTHPHLRQRGTVRRVRDESIGEFDIPGLPV